jgi:hypothetical protein
MGRGFLYPWLMTLRDTGLEQGKQPKGGAELAPWRMFRVDWLVALVSTRPKQAQYGYGFVSGRICQMTVGPVG